MSGESLAEEPKNPSTQESGDQTASPPLISSEAETLDPISPEPLAISEEASVEPTVTEIISSLEEELESTDSQPLVTAQAAVEPTAPETLFVSEQASVEPAVTEIISSLEEELESPDSQPLATSQEETVAPIVPEAFAVSDAEETVAPMASEPLIASEEAVEPMVAEPFSVSKQSATSVSSIPLPSPSLSTPKKTLRIFITGASGCIGQYIAETLIRETDHELYLFVRDPEKLQFDYNARPGITVVKGNMRDIARFGKLLKTIDCAVLTAAAWGGQQQVMDVNVFKTIQLLNLLDPKVCQQVIYFSTASVLDRTNNILKEASQLGTDYIRSKTDFLRQLSRLPAIAKRTTILFPTLVFGGDNHHPYSHISAGLPEVTKWIHLIRWFKADGSFHFMHAQDIAQVVRYLIDHPRNPEDNRWLVLGNAPMTANQAVEEACAYLNQPISFRFQLSPWLANLFIYLFRIQMSAWDRFCIDYRHFTYQDPVSPATFGLPVYYPTLTDILKTSGISSGQGRVQQVNPTKLSLDDPEPESETAT